MKINMSHVSSSDIHLHVHVIIWKLWIIYERLKIGQSDCLIINMYKSFNVIATLTEDFRYLGHIKNMDE